MAVCGWCKTKGLNKVTNNGDGKGLETHTLPNSRKVCDGLATAPAYQRREKGK